MGININTSKDIDTLDVFLTGINNDTEELGIRMLKLAGEKAKELVVANLEKHRRVLAVRHRPALADDVKLSIKTDKFGEKYAKVMGGKKTGTLWHIVNDGNLHSKPTHFLDDALKSLDGEIDELWRKAEG